MSPFRLREAARAIRGGGIVACPTEAVYGLHCDPLDGDAVARVIDLKGRSAAKGLIVLAAGMDQLEPYVDLPDAARERLAATWPGPVTWVVPARPGLPSWVTGERPSVAVRVTAHPVAAALAATAGTALISTSANRSGLDPARDPLGVRRAFGHAVDVVLHAPTGGRAGPTEIRDLASGRVLRPG